MGQKVSPHGFRVGVIKDWEATWYANKKDFGKFLLEDNTIREFIQKKYKDALISRVVVQRTQGEKLVVDIHTGKPGVIIGQKGAGIETLRKELVKIAAGKQVTINIKEVKQLDLNSAIVAQGIATQLEKRVLVKRAMKASIQRVMKAGALGCKITVSGRINGAEIARAETISQGSIPLHTLRADIDYGVATAATTYGALGVKVWIYKGEVLDKPVKNTSNKGGEQ